jgi:hydroxyacylglutathione hydrolase
MKALNRDGVPPLGAVPMPPVVADVRAHAAAWEAPGTVVVDTRPWPAFRDGHLPGALYAPLGKMLPMVVGSFVKPAERIVLVCDLARADEIVRDLVRIGYDHVIAVVAPDSITAATGVKLETTPEMTAAEANAARGSAFILDVRGAAEYAVGHLEEACNVAYTRLLPHIAELPRGERIVVHCALGGRSAAATSMLRRMGFDAVNVAGGFEGWKKAGLPTAAPTSRKAPVLSGVTAAIKPSGGCCGGSCHG